MKLIIIISNITIIVLIIVIIIFINLNKTFTVQNSKTVTPLTNFFNYSKPTAIDWTPSLRVENKDKVESVDTRTHTHTITHTLSQRLGAQYISRSAVGQFQKLNSQLANTITVRNLQRGNYAKVYISLHCCTTTGQHDSDKFFFFSERNKCRLYIYAAVMQCSERPVGDWRSAYTQEI